MIDLDPLFPDYAALAAAENVPTETLHAVRRALASRRATPVRHPTSGFGSCGKSASTVQGNWRV